MTKWQNFTDNGYSPNDGLGAGRWVPIPGTAGVQRWVGELEPKAERVRPRGECACGADIDHRSERCRSCAAKQWNVRLRDAS